MANTQRNDSWKTPKHAYFVDALQGDQYVRDVIRNVKDNNDSTSTSGFANVHD